VTVEEAIVARLLAVPAVTSLVADRISRHTRDQDPAAIPAITYEGAGLEEIVSLDGPTGAGRVSLQIDCWAADGDGAEVLALEVRDALQVSAGSGINAAFRKNKVGAEQDPEVQVWRVRSTWNVHYSAAVAA
jgi:hypothetical protein